MATKEMLGGTVEIAKRNELHTFAVIPKRWVVERSFAWLEKCRRLWKNCERKINTSLQMTVLAFLVLLLDISFAVFPVLRREPQGKRHGPINSVKIIATPCNCSFWRIQPWTPS